MNEKEIKICLKYCEKIKQGMSVEQARREYNQELLKAMLSKN